MKNIVIFILVFIFTLFFMIIINKATLEKPRHNGAIIIEKVDIPVFGKWMTFNYGDSIRTEKVYQIFHEKYNVGDTVKFTE